MRAVDHEVVVEPEGGFLCGGAASVRDERAGLARDHVDSRELAVVAELAVQLALRRVMR